MSLKEKNYKPRLIDDKIIKYLDTFGAILIEGPKWCGKTWTALNHAMSVTYMTEDSNKKLAFISPKSIFLDRKPQLIDEWQIVPDIWDAVRHECDKNHETGKFILTGSTTMKKEERKKKIFHSGTGRIVRMKMSTMSLYESNDSTGDISIMEMYNSVDINKNVGKTELGKLADLIIRGGWPSSLSIKLENQALIPKAYIDSVLNIETEENDKVRDKNKLKMLLNSLARNESSTVNNNTIIKDIEEYEKGSNILQSRTTLIEYLDFLNRLHLIDNQEAYSNNYRSPERVGKSVKRHFCDPSLACACLNLNKEKLLGDLNTFGFLFEALVERDLRVYMNYLDGNLYHFRDNVSGLEVDSILEFSDGEYAAVEIKLGQNDIDLAIANLQKFYDSMIKKPKFMCVIVGVLSIAYKDPKSNIYVIPITALKP